MISSTSQSFIKRFADIFDGFSIGSNDLTQLILGELGIDSISLNPDTVLKTTPAILEQESASNSREVISSLS